MDSLAIYTNISNGCSQSITQKYSTSFYSAIQLLHKSLRQPIYNIYGFVRLADEIVDTFHNYNKQELLSNFRQETYNALQHKISLNPILHSFQQTVYQYNIDPKLIDDFLSSMELDVTKKNYTSSEYQQYIYGSAEVVGLMCLHIFCNGNAEMYNELAPYSKSLGAAFQKVNFLRDIKADNESLQRMYFPNCNFGNFTNADKLEIEKDIQNDFEQALIGIKQLPNTAKFGVYVAYKYYYNLFKKIQKISSKKIVQQRVRIPNFLKAFIVAQARVEYQFNAI